MEKMMSMIETLTAIRIAETSPPPLLPESHGDTQQQGHPVTIQVPPVQTQNFSPPVQQNPQVQPQATGSQIPLRQSATHTVIPDVYETVHDSIKEKEKKVANKLESLEGKVRSLQGIDAYGDTGFSSLCFFPNLKLPPKYKTPDL